MTITWLSDLPWGFYQASEVWVLKCWNVAFSLVSHLEVLYSTPWLPGMTSLQLESGPSHQHGDSARWGSQAWWGTHGGLWEESESVCRTGEQPHNSSHCSYLSIATFFSVDTRATHSTGLVSYDLSLNSFWIAYCCVQVFWLVSQEINISSCMSSQKQQ